MSGDKELKVRVEIGDVKAEFEGSVEEVFKAFTSFLAKTYPALEVVQRIIFTPDLAQIAESLGSFVQITPEGPILLDGRELPASDAITLVLLAAYAGNRLNKLQKDSLSVMEINRITGKAHKTVANQIPWMLDGGIIERVGKGEYRVTSRGIKQGENILAALRSSRKG